MKRTVKILLILSFCIQVILSTIGVCAIYDEIIAHESDIKKININNFLCNYENKIISIDGLTYVPLRETFEMIGAEVRWYNSDDGSVVKIYTSDLYDENIDENGVRYCYYKEKIDIEKDDISDIGFKYSDKVNGSIVANTPEELVIELKECCDKDPKNNLYTVKDGVWYNIYQNKSIWIVYMQLKGGTLDTDELYTIDKNTGEIIKFTSIGTSNLLNDYIGYIK